MQIKMLKKEKLFLYPIKNHPGSFVTKEGEIYSTHSGALKIKKVSINRSGYLQLMLYPKRINYTVHRLVAQTLIPNPLNKRTVNHKNGIKTDNRVENLEWNTDSENQLHALQMGLRGYSGPPKKRVFAFDLEGTLRMEYPSLTEAARVTKIRRSCIRSCCNQQNNRETAGGYKWSFTAGQSDEQCKKILLNVCQGKYRKREKLGDIE